MAGEISTLGESAAVGAHLPAQEPVRWRCQWTLEKFLGDPDGAPAEVVQGEGNLLVTAGATALLNLLTGAGGTAFNNANAYIGVGDSTAAAAIGQTDLQASTNKLRKAMDATYPSVSGAVATFRSTFGSSDANFAWQEFAVFNASTSGTMLNRAVSALGTKASGSTWTFTVTITLS